VRILYLTTGDNVHDYRFLVRLFEKGYDTHAVYLQDKVTEYGVDGVASHFLGYDARQGLAHKAVSRLLALSRLRRLLRIIRPDVLHAGPVTPGGLLAAASRFRPFLLMPWGSDILVNPDRSTLLRRVTHYVVRRADMVFTDAQAVKQRIVDLTSYDSGRIVVFPWGLDLGLFRPSAEQRRATRGALGWADKKIVVLSRSLTPIYGFEDFIRSLPAVVRAVPETRVLLIGSGPLEDTLHRAVAALGLSDRVRFMGRIANRHLPPYLNASDLYVTSSLSDGTSMSLLESLACGLPVVVTDVPANMEWVEDGVNGLIVPRRDPEAMSRALVTLLQDEGTRRKMGERNLAIARDRADWDKNFQKLEQVYRTLRDAGTARAASARRKTTRMMSGGN
jgi:glycosyltransferase involved in cell wall biosynthesis